MAIVYVGIDVHKRTYSFTATKDGAVIKRGTCLTKPITFADSLRKWFPEDEIRTCYEAGCTGFRLHRILETKGILNIVINPGSVARAPNDKIKNDALDSKLLSLHLSKDLLAGIYIPSLNEQADRSLVRIRQQLVEQRTMVSNQKAFFYTTASSSTTTLGP